MARRLEDHPLAAGSPDLSPEEYSALVEDIGERGLAIDEYARAEWGQFHVYLQAHERFPSCWRLVVIDAKALQQSSPNRAVNAATLQPWLSMLGIPLHELRWRVEKRCLSPRGREPEVYFLYAPQLGLVKMGLSLDIEGRLRSLRNTCPVELILLGKRSGGRSEEARLHRKFACLRRQGEWFRAEARLLEEAKRGR